MSGLAVSEASIFHIKLPFKRSFSHNLAVRRESENVILKLKLSDRTLGYGESVPRDYVTGETVDSVVSTLKEAFIPALRNQSFESMHDFMHFLRNGVMKSQDPRLNGAAKCVFELALIDAFTKALKQSVFSIIGGPKLSFVRYSASIPITSLASLKKYAWFVKLFGFKEVKVKVKGTDEDETRIAYVRKILGDKVNIRLDANCAWSWKQALEKIRCLQRFNISSVEEPIAARDFEGLAQLRKESNVPITVDESLCTLEDAELLIRNKACDIFNVRISKCGGLLNSLTLIDLARKNNLAYLIGCQVGESGILSAAGRHLTFATGDALHLEGSYSGLLLREDITIPKVRFGWGAVGKIIKGPGLGVLAREDRLRKYLMQKQQIAVQGER